ncbi:MAG: hypothetical protein KAW56_12415 [Candidatus Marinimicrobia bacterium]|nr:hypothetical protein [Candidatus Neomarinimicrobiota bacterium]
MVNKCKRITFTFLYFYTIQLFRNNYETKHFADSILRGIDGDLRVKDDKIIATLYNVPESLNLKQYYEDLPNKLEREGINPKIPWLFDFKLDFRFK